MKGIYYPIAQHLVQFCKGNQFVIWRDAFRWKKHLPFVEYENSWSARDEVLPNHYDGMELEQLCEEFGYEIDWEFNLRHVAIVKRK